MIGSISLVKKRRLNSLQQEILRSTDFGTWQRLAQQHDDLIGATRWRRQEENSLYDHAEIRARHDRLARLLADRNYQDLLFALNEDLHGNKDVRGPQHLAQARCHQQRYQGCSHN